MDRALELDAAKQLLELWQHPTMASVTRCVNARAGTPTRTVAR